MNSTAIFAMALNIKEPWYIKEIKLEKSKESRRGQLDIFIDFEVGAKFIDELGDVCSVYDTEQRSWQHLNFFEHNCFIHARVPRIEQKSGKVKTVSVPGQDREAALHFYLKPLLCCLLSMRCR